MKRLIVSLFIVVFTFSVAYAATLTSPASLLEKRANQLVDKLKQNKNLIKKDKSYVMNIVSQAVLPLVDQERMARSVFRRSLWTKASSAQRQAFIKQFRILVLRTYAAAFSHYSDEVVKFRPLRGNWAKQTNVTVQSAIIQQGAPAIPVNYSVTRKGNTWKVYDFTVDGISMISSFRSQFEGINSKTLAQLTKKLALHNQRQI